MLQWKSSSRMVVAGSRTAPRRFPSIPANPAPVLTQQKQESPRAELSSQLCSRSSICRCHRCGAAPRSAGGRACTGNRRETPSSGAAHQHAKHKPKNQARPRNGHSSPRIFVPTDILEGRACSRSSAPKATLAAGGSQTGHHSHPSTSAQGSSLQFMLQNTRSMRESQSLECWPSPCQFWHFSQQSTRNKSHSPCWFTG